MQMKEIEPKILLPNPVRLILRALIEIEIENYQKENHELYSDNEGIDGRTKKKGKFPPNAGTPHKEPFQDIEMALYNHSQRNDKRLEKGSESNTNRPTLPILQE